MVVTLYSLQALITSLISFFVGFFVFSRNRQSLVNKTFWLWTLSVAIWAFGISMHTLTDDAASGLIWSRFLHGAAIFIPSFFIHFTFAVLNIRDNKWIIKFSYLASLALFAFNFTNLFISGVRPVLSFKYFPIAGPVYPLFILMFAFCVLYSLYSMFKAIKNSSGIKRNQIRYLFLGAAIGFSGGSTTFFPMFGIKVFPIGNLFIFLYITLIAYAITRHHLMDIEVVIKKSLVFAGMFAFVFGVVVAVAMLVSQFFAAAGLASLAISALIITFTLRPIEAWLVNATDKFLFQKKYEYKQVMKTFIDEVVTVVNMDEIVNSTLKLLDETVHPYASAIFVVNKLEDKYQLYDSSGLEDKNISFTSESHLVNFFKKSRNPAVIKQIDGVIGVSPQIQQEMRLLKAVLCLPLILHEDLIGFISLGKKKSDEDYTKEDLDILSDLARTESIAVGNAQLLTEAAQAERRAAIGTMAAGIHHEVGNPLNIINTKIQLFSLSVQKGLFRNKTKGEVVQECESILNETIKQTNRISETTKKLANFAKPSKEFKPELLSVSEQIDETMAVLGHELELERIKIERKISLDLPKILADRREMQQIFFNIIRNAAQSIENKGSVIISAMHGNNKVHVEVQDTGVGIPEDKRHRVFEPFFTTKGPSKGTGLGLSIVRQLVWRNKGEITFRSQVGVGTTFILEFPKGA